MESKKNSINFKIEDIEKLGNAKCFRKYGISIQNIKILIGVLENLQIERLKKGGRKPIYSTLKKLLMFLTKLKKNFSFEDLSEMFGISITRCHETVDEYLFLFSNYNLFPNKINETIEDVKKNSKIQIVDSTLFQINKPKKTFLNIFLDLKENIALKFL